MNTSKIYSLVLVGGLAILLGVFIYRGGDDAAPAPLPSPDSLPASAPEPAQQASSEPAPPAPVPLAAREAVLELTGLSGTGTVTSRRQALAALPRDLNAQELQAIYTGILEQARPDGISLRAWHALYNDTLNALVLHQTKPVADLPDRLMATIQDDARHRVIRDYSLQHLLAFAEYRMEGSARINLLESAWEAVSETRDSYHGTYLAALSYQADQPGWLSGDAVAAKAWQVAVADDAHVLSRITALQVCGKLGYADALPLALEIAGDTRAHMTLRTSAIATIGDLGSRSQKKFLDELAERSPPRLLVAIEAARTRIKAKETQV